MSDPAPPSTQPHSRLAWATRFKWTGFRLLERLAGGASARPGSLPPLPARDALWIFVSTIGELNAIGPFLRELIQRQSHLQLVLMTDRSIYRASYLAQYPQAEIVEIDANNAHAAVLAAARPPRLMIVAEIPCLPSDAPCRLPFGYLYAARQAGARIALVNGWLYGYAPNCRMDHIERQWLSRDYLSLFDLLCVQNEAVARDLITTGADAARVHVTGNIKFDALDSTPRPLAQTRSPQLLDSLSQSSRPVIVAGCVTDGEERDLVLDAFILLRATHVNAALVLAPRHPENPEVMKNLHAALNTRQLAYRLRSTSPDQAFPIDEAVLVLDTMGELRDFYAVATVAHVGRDHNLLEPLAYGKFVTIRPGWDRTYPSYPVFDRLARTQAMQIVNDARQLTQSWQSWMDSSRDGHGIVAVVTQESGATKRCLSLLTSMLA